MIHRKHRVSSELVCLPASTQAAFQLPSASFTGAKAVPAISFNTPPRIVLTAPFPPLYCWPPPEGVLRSLIDTVQHAVWQRSIIPTST
ncbi:uncharacterized protein BDW43DRAFT_283596 [Aspergillus alliaceus]|uniref:uncharacterized protein n=1 Tax=Petromyces alliaceus TaxID=209559 RepID=UPI0012A4B135|nr:uncharacterized protein BDW43DRAFT_283596 [Aspergillus alliaceus]KAB8231096.1 hypothetical protein BDW43DRAFT_283596 [Aspergillus alliaceus]